MYHEMTCLGEACSCWRMTGLLFVAVNSSIKISINHKTSTNTLRTCTLNLNFPSFYSLTELNTMIRILHKKILKSLEDWYQYFGGKYHLQS